MAVLAMVIPACKQDHEMSETLTVRACTDPETFWKSLQDAATDKGVKRMLALDMRQTTKGKHTVLVLGDQQLERVHSVDDLEHVLLQTASTGYTSQVMIQWIFEASARTRVLPERLGLPGDSGSKARVMSEVLGCQDTLAQILYGLPLIDGARFVQTSKLAACVSKMELGKEMSDALKVRRLVTLEDKDTRQRVGGTWQRDELRAQGALKDEFTLDKMQPTLKLLRALRKEVPALILNS